MRASVDVETVFELFDAALRVVGRARDFFPRGDAAVFESFVGEKRERSRRGDEQGGDDGDDSEAARDVRAKNQPEKKRDDGDDDAEGERRRAEKRVSVAAESGDDDRRDGEKAQGGGNDALLFARGFFGFLFFFGAHFFRKKKNTCAPFLPASVFCRSFLSETAKIFGKIFVLRMKFLILILFFVSATLCVPAVAAEVPAGQDVSGKDAAVPAEEVFNAKNAAILGVVEGLTEYLPVSSTGHLILANSALGLDGAEPIVRRGGSAGELVRDRDGSDFSVKEAADAYSIIIQFGAIVAVFFAYWKRCTGTIVGVFRRDPASWRLSRNLIVAFVPAAGLGFFFSDKIEEHLFNPVTVACALIVGGVLMLVVDRRQKKLAAARGGNAEDGPDLQDLSVRQALTIGAMQCIALWPGMSRSMATIVGGYVAGLSPRRATEFSFLLGLITLSAASIYKTLQCAEQMRDSFGLGVSAVGLGVAFVAAFASVKWMVEWISRHGLSAFAWYRFALAAAVLWFMA